MLHERVDSAEVLVKPYASGDPGYIAAYERLLSGSPSLQLFPIGRDILEASAKLRAALGGKLADAIHVATASVCDCSHFLTEDARIKVPEGITVVGTGGILEMLAATRPDP